MATITSKAILKPVVEGIQAERTVSAKVAKINSGLLQHKIKFPLLEYATWEIIQGEKKENLIGLADGIINPNTIGGNVLAGIILQHIGLTGDIKTAFIKAGEYMVAGNEWYVCDIIGERVMGHCLLMMPEKAIPLLKGLAKSEEKWLKRSVGVATHYATKKGLPEKYVIQMFELLLTMADTTEFHAKTGTGWGAKTIAKFYPFIIDEYHAQIYDNPNVKQWFKTKIAIGLSRKEKYANRY